MTPGSTGDKETMVGGAYATRASRTIPRDGKLPAKGGAQRSVVRTVNNKTLTGSEPYTMGFDGHS